MDIQGFMDYLNTLINQGVFRRGVIIIEEIN